MLSRFLVFSGFAAAMNLGVGYLLYAVLGLNSPIGYACSVAVAFLAGMLVSFTLNRRFTFAASGRRVRHELRDFFVVSLIGLSLTTLLSHVFLQGIRLTDLLGRLGGPPWLLPETAAHLGAIATTAIYSFLAHRYISFRPARHSSSQI